MFVFGGFAPCSFFFVLLDLRVFLEKAEGRRAVRMRSRSRVVRSRAGRTRARATVHAPPAARTRKPVCVAAFVQK